jgi:hypothetical protein
MRTQEELARSIVPPGAGADFTASSHAGLVLLTPVSEDARAWLSSHVSAEASWNAGSLVLDMQFFPALADAILDAGFRFERDA